MYIQKTEIQYKLLSINIEGWSVLAIFGILVFAQDMGYLYSVWAVLRNTLVFDVYTRTQSLCH
jgi:hypothetical protein